MNTVSVVIPSKNGIETIKRCLDGILKQTVDVKEIVVVDSGSRDGTIELLQLYDKVKLIEIPEAEFNHGSTRNLGVQYATGKYVVLTVQDAWPADEHWLENLLIGFDSPAVAAVCGQQIVPHDKDKNPVQWFKPYSKPEIVSYNFSRDVFESMIPTEKQAVCAWDDVTAMYKRDVLLRLPFRQTPFAEDAWWANDAFLAGYTLAYNYNAKVNHYHHYSYEAAFKRIMSEMYSMYKIFGVKPSIEPPTGSYYLRTIKLLLKANNVSMAERFKWFSYNLNLKKAACEAAATFDRAIQSGEQALDNMYDIYCRTHS